MEHLERELHNFTLGEPPKWLKARAVVAAQNELARQRSRRHLQAVMWVSIAAGLALAAVGHYVADLLTPPVRYRTRAITAAPMPVDPSEFFSAADVNHARRNFSALRRQLTEDQDEVPVETSGEEE
jgi:hypothetical protein